MQSNPSRPVNIGSFPPEHSLFQQAPKAPRKLAVIDVGSRYLKGFMLDPKGHGLEFKAPSGLGKALGELGELNTEAVQLFLRSWNHVSGLLRQAGVHSKDCLSVATEGLRGCKKVGQQLANALSIQLLSGKEEGRFTFNSLMYRSGADPTKSVAVEIGGASTELAFHNAELNQCFALGGERSRNGVNLRDKKALSQLRNKLTRQIKAELSASARQAIEGKQLWLNLNPDFATLMGIPYKTERSVAILNKATLETWLNEGRTGANKTTAMPLKLDELTTMQVVLCLALLDALGQSNLHTTTNASMRLGLMLHWLKRNQGETKDVSA